MRIVAVFMRMTAFPPVIGGPGRGGRLAGAITTTMSTTPTPKFTIMTTTTITITTTATTTTSGMRVNHMTPPLWY